MVTPASGQLGPDILASDPCNAERRRMEELADKLLGKKNLAYIEPQLGVLPPLQRSWGRSHRTTTFALRVTFALPSSARCTEV